MKTRIVCLATVCIATAGCSDPYRDYREVLKSGRAEIPWVSTVERYFPEQDIDHFITHYGFDEKAKQWQTVVYFGDRYRMQIIQSVNINYKTKKVTSLESDFDFVINEVISYDPASREASYGAQARGGPKEWQKFEDAKGDLSSLPLKIVTDNPLDHFDSYRKGWGEGLIK